jgi:hypothetical protein
MQLSSASSVRRPSNPDGGQTGRLEHAPETIGEEPIAFQQVAQSAFRIAGRGCSTFVPRSRTRSSMICFELMKAAGANAIISAVAAWALTHEDIRALALVGSWARGNPYHGSDVTSCCCRTMRMNIGVARSG